MLSSDDLKLYAAVLQAGSFSQAAIKNDITTAAISKRISLLEKKLGVKLINRTTRKSTPTEMGLLLYQHCERVMAEIEQAELAITQAHLEPKGKIKICSPTNFANLKLAPLMAEFIRKHAGIEFEVTLNDTRAMPMDGDHDLVIRAGKIPERNVIARELVIWNWAVCATKGYFHQYGMPKIPGDLKRHNCIDYDYRQSRKVWYFYQRKKTYKIKIQGNIASNNALYIKHMALHGMGIAFLPRFMVEQELAEGKLIRALENYSTQGIPVYILYPQGKHLPHKVRLFIDFILDKFKNHD